MRTLILGLAVLVTVRTASAQNLPAGTALTSAQCTALAGLVGPSDRWGTTWGRVAECGTTGANALGSAISTARSSTDSIYLRALLSVASRVSDPGLLTTTLAVAQDRTASDQARIIATLVAYAQLDERGAVAPGLSWAATVLTPWGLTCRQLGDAGDGRYASQTALPSNAATQAGTALDAIIFADPPNSHPVIDVAKCVRTRLTSLTPDAANPATISLTYVCGNTFRVTNTSPKWISVSYAVSHSNETGDLEVAPNSTEDFEVDIKDTVLLTYLGQTIRTVANGATTCPP